MALASCGSKPSMTIWDEYMSRRPAFWRETVGMLWGVQQSLGLYPKRTRLRHRLGGAERLHDCGPGLRQIAAVIPAAAEREQPPLAVPIRQRRQLACRSGMTGA